MATPLALGWWRRFGAAFFAVTFFGAPFVLADEIFLAVGFLGGPFFAGIGMAIPGMFMFWASAGAGAEASAKALTATNKLNFTDHLQRRRRVERRLRYLGGFSC